MKYLFCLLLLHAACVFSKNVNYTNFKVYRVEAATAKQFKFLKSLEINKNVNYWTELVAINRSVKIMVTPGYYKEFEDTLLENKIKFRMVIDDVERVIQTERDNTKKQKPIKNGDVAFDRYLRYSEIQDYLARLAIDHKDLVRVENYGKSYENRNLTLMTISTGGNGQKPLIFVDAGIHASEWLGISEALYIIDQLLDNPDNKQLIENVDWVIIPLLNPDGYEYSHTADRLWRKTRTKGKVCDGVDPNRNFDFHWLGQGGSNDECSFTYAGPKPFSELETLALSKVISRYADRAKLYLTYHVPLQSLLYPYGYTAELPENNDELLSLGLKVADAIYAVNQTRYQVGTSVQIFTYTSGSSRDWAYGVAKINLSYTVEFPEYPDNSMEMPSECILGQVTEMFEGVKVFHEYVENKYSVI